jgi:hypothetical protein
MGGQWLAGYSPAQLCEPPGADPNAVVFWGPEIFARARKRLGMDNTDLSICCYLMQQTSGIPVRLTHRDPEYPATVLNLQIRTAHSAK